MPKLDPKTDKDLDIIAENPGKIDKLNLKTLTPEIKNELIIKLLQEQFLDQRTKLTFWKELTGQASQVDTGYIGQHLVSLITGLQGSTMRGKGDDLVDGSEVKSANFLDSLDKKGAVAPRWNFSSNDIKTMNSYLEVPNIYLVSIDLNPAEKFRARAWQLNPREHLQFNARYKEWMKKLGLPKLSDPKRPGVNFQLFPPRFKTEDDFARHGNGRENGFDPLKIELENTVGAKKILHAEEIDNKIQIITLDFDVE